MVSQSRRSFLAVAGAGLATTGGLLWANQTWADRGRVTAVPSRSRYLAAVGSEFSIDGDPTVRLRLEEVSDLLGAPTGSEKSFSLVFSSVDGTALSPEIHTFGHEKVGAAELFASAIDRGAALRYEAIINTHTPEELS